MQKPSVKATSSNLALAGDIKTKGITSSTTVETDVNTQKIQYNKPKK
jgi:hypothetical protein